MPVLGLSQSKVIIVIDGGEIVHIHTLHVPHTYMYIYIYLYTHMTHMYVHNIIYMCSTCNVQLEI